MNTKTIATIAILASLAACGTPPGIDCPTDGTGYHQHKTCGENETSQRASVGISPSVTSETGCDAACEDDRADNKAAEREASS